ncbi:hypothetical protein ARMGADRAFT_1074975 [Armillaria gallica]|uniref:Uncharacterized protein n=1 Tax=Armillaria gallica TaxID=47427 RepID=A0A2H3EC74_ARMGA|nr:hypothetical protein ARMGADRAFT_1074975 [Armillaria gallica]
MDIDAAAASRTIEPMWPDFDGETPQRAYKEPYSSAHPSQDPSVVSSPPVPGSPPRTVAASLSTVIARFMVRRPHRYKGQSALSLSGMNVSAYKTWKNSRTLANSLLRLPNPVDVYSPDLMCRFAVKAGRSFDAA